jgi:hypothetical protein
MDPVRIAIGSPFPCRGRGGMGACLSRLTSALADALAARFDARGSVTPNTLAHEVRIELRDPLLDAPTAGEHVLLASIALRARDGGGRTGEIVPRVIGELIRRRPRQRWQWIEQDTYDKLGSFLEEIHEVLDQVRRDDAVR